MWSSAEELLLTRSRSASIMVSGCERYSYSGMGARYWGENKLVCHCHKDEKMKMKKKKIIKSAEVEYTMLHDSHSR